MNLLPSFTRNLRKTSPSRKAITDPTCKECFLNEIGEGQSACLICVGGKRHLRRRLAEMGLTPGVEMTVLQNKGGPMLLSVRDSRLAIGRGMAQQLEVTPL